MEEELSRIRVVFDDGTILTGSQRSDGLKQSWLRLNPGIATISDLASYIRKSFGLEPPCELVLSMDDFVFPPFESTRVLKNTDIISVRKKDATLIDAIELGDDRHIIQDSQGLEKQQNTLSIVKPLAITEYGEDSGRGRKDKEDFSAENDDAVHTEIPSKLKNKRKHPDGVQESKKKKPKISFIKPMGEEDRLPAEEDEEIHLEKSITPFERSGSSKKSSKKKNKPYTGDDTLFVGHQLEEVKLASCSVQREKRNVQAKETITGNTCEPHTNDTVAKVQGRNARRKKARRQWLRDTKSKEDQNSQGQSLPSIIHRELPEQQESEQNAELEIEIVPVVIKPGHIRFLPLDEEHGNVQSPETETLQWNGTTSKKKGQKWGREKTVSTWNDTNGYNEQSSGKEHTVSKWKNPKAYKEQNWISEKTMSRNSTVNGGKDKKWITEKTMSKCNDTNGYIEHTEQGNAKAASKWGKWNNSNGDTEQIDKMVLPVEDKSRNGHVDFESLFPLTRIPQVGDIIAYRIIELSTSWCPEVSSFRVGQVTSYNYLTMNVILIPVPEYPIFPDEDIGEDPMLQANPSLYNEDGSLQIHYPSLIDVRLLKASDSDATTSEFSGIEMSTLKVAPVESGKEMSTEEAAPVNNSALAVVNNKANYSGREASTQTATHVNNWELAMVNNKPKEIVQPTENGNVSGSTWDQIKQALNEKKAQLQKKKDGWDEWAPNKSNANTSWSYRALRGSAVGPTLAYLRGRNVKRPQKK